MCLIVVLDQFSRHICRRRGEAAGSALQAAADAAALSAAEALLDAGWEARLSVPEHIFALMPLRHNGALLRLERAMAQVRSSAASHATHAFALAAADASLQAEARAEVETTHAALLVRFRRATLRRLQDARGRTWRPGDELLEHHGFAADESQMLREPLAQTVRAPARLPSAARFKAGCCPTGAQDSLARLQVVAFFTRHQAAAVAALQPAAGTPADELPVRAVVSLSGGVDSMVLAFILSRMGAGRWRVAGVHIDYGNRPESGAEADFVAAWCAEQGIVFRLKRIEELRRCIAGRDEYERESRRIRYDFYAACLAEFAGCGGVCVGHHAGDVQENVITNLLKGTSLLAVSGMAEVSTVNGIPVWCVLAAAHGDACTLRAGLAFARVQAAAAALGKGRGVFVRAPLRRAVLPVRVLPDLACAVADS